MRVCLAGRHAPALLRMVAVLLGAMTFSAASSSANLYVTTTGNNAGNCQTLGAPCLTIAYALSQAAAGDTINIGGGTFTEELTISKSVVLEMTCSVRLVGACGGWVVGVEPQARPVGVESPLALCARTRKQ